MAKLTKYWEMTLSAILTFLLFGGYWILFLVSTTHLLMHTSTHHDLICHASRTVRLLARMNLGRLSLLFPVSNQRKSISKWTTTFCRSTTRTARRTRLALLFLLSAARSSWTKTLMSIRLTLHTRMASSLLLFQNLKAKRRLVELST